MGHNILSEIVYLFESEPFDPSSGEIKNVNFSQGLLTEGDLDTDDPYPVRLSQAFTHETSIFDANIPGSTTISIGSSTVNNADGRFDHILNYSWDTRSVTIKKGIRGQPYASYATEFVGSILEVIADQTNLVFTLRDNSHKLIKLVQTNKYSGAGGKHGSADLREKPKPLLFGPTRNLAPVWLDSALLTSQIHDGPVVSVDAVYDRGIPLGFNANFATYELLIAATIPPGYYGTCLAEGYLRLGAPPDGAVTVDATGEYSTATSLPELAKEVLLDRLELVSGDLDESSFDEAALDAPYAYEGLYFQTPEFQGDEFLETIASAINGFWYVSKLGLITLRQFRFRDPEVTVREEDLMSLGKASSPHPIHKVRVNYAKNPTVLGPSEFVIPRQTFNGFLTKPIHRVDATAGSPSYAGAGEFKVFLNDTQINDLEQVQFRVRDGQTWITIDPLGVITVTDPGSNTASAVLRANIGEFYIDEEFTVIKDVAAPYQSLILSLSADRFVFDNTGAPDPTSQVITITPSGSNVTNPVTYFAEDNLGQDVAITGGNQLSIANVSNSPLTSFVELTATDSAGIQQKRRIPIQHGDDAYAAGVLGALSAANKAITVFYQNDAPVSGMAVDDIWVDTNDANKMYRWTGSTWAAISDTRIVDALTQAAGAQATADGKIKTFFTESTPTATAVGDLWYKPSTKSLFRWDGADWLDAVATFGATAGSSLFNSGGSTLSDSQVQNSAVTMNPDGSISGAGGGQATLPGMGFLGELGATGSENLIINGFLASSALSGWSIPGSSAATWTASSTGDPVPAYLRATVNTPSVVSSYKVNGGDTPAAISVRPGEIILFSWYQRSDLINSNNARLTYRIQQKDAAGVVTNGTSTIVQVSVANVWQKKTVLYVVPDNTAKIWFEFGFVVSTGATYVDAGGFRASRSEEGATYTKDKGEWAAATLYKVGDFVQYNGSSFIATVEHTSDTNFPPGHTSNTQFEILAIQGRATEIRWKRSATQPSTPTGNSPTGWTTSIPSGSDPLWQTTAIKDGLGNLIGNWSTPISALGLVNRGPYSSSTTYYMNDAVTYNGGSYVAIQNNFSNQAPSGTAQANTYWDVLAAPGETAGGGSQNITLTLNQTVNGTTNLRSLADAQGYTGGDLTLTVNISGTYRGTNSGHGIRTGTFPTNKTIAITINAQATAVVDGGGGRGGDGMVNGSTGGDAFYIEHNVSGGLIRTAGSVIRGGGGGGGGGTSIEGSFIIQGGAGGGGGFPNGGGGSGLEGSQKDVETGFWSPNGVFGPNGGGGTTSGGGAGGNPSGTERDGGAGGGAATAGTAGGGSGGGDGGAAGYAVRKNGKTCNVTGSGTITGTVA